MNSVVPARRKARRQLNKQSPNLRKVRFEFAHPTARSVQLVGSFNQWKADNGEMTRLTDGKWVKELALAPGTYEYRYVVDGSLRHDPNADHSVTNPSGERNSLLSVSGRRA
jgi:1,4-alpha-glucan branching enzyme